MTWRREARHGRGRRVNRSELRGRTLTAVQLSELPARLAMAKHDLQVGLRFFTELDCRTRPAGVAIKAETIFAKHRKTQTERVQR